MRIYIEGMKEIPKDCGKCPIHRLIYSLHPASAICPIMKGTPKDITDIYERSPNCPLREQRQPNRFEAVVHILKDADFGPDDDMAEEEEYIKMIADEICQLFKDGPYDEEGNMITLSDKEEKAVQEIISENEKLEEENKKLREQVDLLTSIQPDDRTSVKNKNLELIIDVKAKGAEEAEERIRKLKEALDSFPAMIQIQKLENCEVNVYPSQTYFGGSDDE